MFCCVVVLAVPIAVLCSITRVQPVHLQRAAFLFGKAMLSPVKSTVNHVGKFANGFLAPSRNALGDGAVACTGFCSLPTQSAMHSGIVQNDYGADGARPYCLHCVRLAALWQFLVGSVHKRRLHWVLRAIRFSPPRCCCLPPFSSKIMCMVMHAAMG